MKREDHMTLYAISAIANSSLNTLQLVKSVIEGQNKRGARRQTKHSHDKMQTNADIEAIGCLELIVSGDREKIIAKADEIMSRQYGKVEQDKPHS